MQTGTFSAILASKQTLIGDLGGGFATAMSDIEAGDGCDAIRGAAEGLPTLGKAETKWANDAGRDDGYAGGGTCFVKSVKTQNITVRSPAILFAFPIEALYTMTPKGENSSSEVRRLSHGKQSAAI
jgi:hypothetical protein